MGHSGRHHGGSFHTGSHHSGGLRGGRSFGSRGINFRRFGHYSYYSDEDASEEDMKYIFIVYSIIFLDFIALVLSLYLSKIGLILGALMITISVIVNFKTKNTADMFIDSYFKLPCKRDPENEYPPIFTKDYNWNKKPESFNAEEAKTDGKSWYNKYDYHLDLSNIDNIYRLREIKSKTSFLTQQLIWTWVLQFILLFSPFILSSDTKVTIGNTTYNILYCILNFLPPILILGICFLRIQLRKNIARKIRTYAIQIVDENAINHPEKIITKPVEPQKPTFWYYNVCPKCNTKSTTSDKECPSCGTSLLIYNRLLSSVPAPQRHTYKKAITSTKSTSKTSIPAVVKTNTKTQVKTSKPISNTYNQNSRATNEDFPIEEPSKPYHIAYIVVLICLLPLAIMLNKGLFLSIIAFAIAMVIHWIINERYGIECIKPYYDLPHTLDDTSRFHCIYTKPCSLNYMSSNNHADDIITDGKSWINSSDFYLDLNNKKNLYSLHSFKNESNIFIHKPLPIVLLFILTCIPLFYNITILPFENIKMSDEAFAFIDFALYYLPSILVFFLGIIRGIQIVWISKKVRVIVKAIIEQNSLNNTADDLSKDITYIKQSFWYYNICPNCGTKASQIERKCGSCGSSLLISSDKIELVLPDKRHHVND